MNTKPLLLSVAITMLLAACGGSDIDQTQPPPEQPQPSVPPPVPTPPPEDKTPESPPPSQEKTPSPSPSSPSSPSVTKFEPPKHPGMKEVPDYARAMTTEDALKAMRDKVIEAGYLSLASYNQVKAGNVADAHLKYLNVEVTDPARMTPIREIVFLNPLYKPAKWHDGNFEYRIVFTKPVPFGSDPDPVRVEEIKQPLRVYEQYYSALERFMRGTRRLEYANGKVVETTFPSSHSFRYYGKSMPETDWPATGSAKYLGYAIDVTDNTGFLSYTMDFGAKKGKGTIVGLLPGKTIELQEATLAPIYLSGSVTVDGANAYPDPKGGSDLTDVQYEVEIFGPKAEEIVGIIQTKTKTETIAGFAGQQQEYTP